MAKKVVSRAKFRTGQKVSDGFCKNARVVKVRSEIKYSYLIEEPAGERHWVSEIYLRSPKAR